jgi:hypothetical protein
MTPAFSQARTLVERNSVPPSHTTPVIEDIRARRLSSAAETVGQVERLLDVGELATHVRALSTRFDRR